jgi:hypothetical protein
MCSQRDRLSGALQPKLRAGLLRFAILWDSASPTFLTGFQPFCRLFNRRLPREHPDDY